jgi:hypothetical protein
VVFGLDRSDQGLTGLLGCGKNLLGWRGLTGKAAGRECRYQQEASCQPPHLHAAEYIFSIISHHTWIPFLSKTGASEGLPLKQVCPSNAAAVVLPRLGWQVVL